MYAHYYGSKAKGYTVTICDNKRAVGGRVLPAKNKATARKIAKTYKAIPWNF